MARTEPQIGRNPMRMHAVVSFFCTAISEITEGIITKAFRWARLIPWKTKIHIRLRFRSSYMVVTGISYPIFGVSRFFLRKFCRVSFMDQRAAYCRGYRSITMNSFKEHCTIIVQSALCPVGQGSIIPLDRGYPYIIHSSCGLKKSPFSERATGPWSWEPEEV